MNLYKKYTAKNVTDVTLASDNPLLSERSF